MEHAQSYNGPDSLSVAFISDKWYILGFTRASDLAPVCAVWPADHAGMAGRHHLPPQAGWTGQKGGSWSETDPSDLGLQGLAGPHTWSWDLGSGLAGRPCHSTGLHGQETM